MLDSEGGIVPSNLLLLRFTVTTRSNLDSDEGILANLLLLMTK